MSDFEKWDIREADVPYIDNPNKSSFRPVLIIAPDMVLVLKITTHGHSDRPKPYEYEIFKWQEAGLTAPSYIQCDKYIRLNKDRFTGKKYGKLKMTDIIGVETMMRYHGLIR